MKRKIFACSLVAICLSVIVGCTIAFFTSEEKAENTITAGNIEIDLLESVNSEEKISIMPGTDVKKVVQVKNVGDHPAYVRVKVNKEIELAENQQGQTDPNLIGVDVNTDFWTEKDGFYYYNGVLKAGEVTEPVFTKIGFSIDMGNMYQNSTAVVNTNAYAVQSENNGDAPLDAAGWPTE